MVSCIQSFCLGKACHHKVFLKHKDTRCRILSQICNLDSKLKNNCSLTRCSSNQNLLITSYNSRNSSLQFSRSVLSHFNKSYRQSSSLWHNNRKVLLCPANNGVTVAAVHQHVRSQQEYVFPLFSAFPASWQPYLRLMRLDRPIGTWLLFLPCTWSISMAAESGSLPDPYYLSLFALGSLLMRGAGCTINDMIDKDFDAKVARTSSRPLASGQLSMLQALALLAAQLSGSLAILLTFNWNTVILGASSLLLVVTYPFMKRITYWPQAVLGLAFNFGTMLGWSAVSGGHIDWGIVLPLYGAGFTWTLVYDTIYAYQDKEDDLFAGVKSTALLFGDKTKYWLTGFAAVSTSALTVAGLFSDQTWPYFIGVGLTAAHLAWQISTVDLTNAEDCGKKFRSNRNLGFLLWVSIVLSNLLKPNTEEKKDKELSNS